MAIIISKNGKNAQKLDESKFGAEDNLQQYILDNPDAIPLYDIDEDTRLFIAAREFPTKSGPIDALGFDQDGNIYVVETKLYKNSDKRTVVAQALDYGASLWKHSISFQTFIAQLDEYSAKRSDSTFKQAFMEFFGLDDADDAFAAIQANLGNGSIKFVVLMDLLHDALKDLVIFINQNSKFDLYAVELEYYKHQSFEIIIPKLYGAEVKKDVSSKSTQPYRVLSNIDNFMESLRANKDDGTLSPVAYDAVCELLEIFKHLSGRTNGKTNFKTVTTAHREVEKMILRDSSNLVTFNLDSDGSVGVWPGDKTGPQIDYANAILNEMVKSKMFDRGENDLSYTRWFFALRPSHSTDMQITEFLKICKKCIKDVNLA